jgi:ABC-type multidrug transport system permease subunit
MFREHGQGLYKISSYYLARLIADLPLFLVTPVIFMSIFYFMVGFSDSVYKFGMTTFVSMLVVQVSISLGIIIFLSLSKVECSGKRLIV